MKKILKLLNFVDLTNNFKKIERDIPLSQGLKPENDSEHSYQLAMISWYIAGVEKIDLDFDKIIKYALVHDLVELYAGDTPLYTTNGKYQNSKKRREKIATRRLRKELRDFNDLHRWIKNYRKKSDDESRFVYAVDKLLPIISIYLDKGYAWKTHKIKIDLLIEKNKSRIAVSPIIQKYFDRIIKIIQKEPRLFEGNKKLFKRVITHNGKRCDVCHVDVDDFNNIPDKLVQKAHAVCLYNGKMLLVNHPEWDIWSIPGGTRDAGETIDDTLRREIYEETNCVVNDCKPIAYQKVISPLGKVYYYRLQYVCNTVPQGKFIKDPAGNINKIKWINPVDFEHFVEEKEFKRQVIRRALEVINKYENKSNK